MRNGVSGVLNQFRQGSPETFEAAFFPASIPLLLYYL